MDSKSRDFDKYYTKRNIATDCSNTIKSLICISDFFWIEPSAGSGNFLFDYVDIAYDLLPESDNIIQGDWLKTPNPNIPYALLGNPPFGKRNLLSKAFIQKSANDFNCKYICFILPEVYNKHTLQKTFPLNWKLIHSNKLPSNSFTLDDNDYHVPCVFQIWARDSELPNLRAIERKVFENKHFTICKKEHADLFVLGASISTVKDLNEVTINNRGYYLKTNLLTKHELKRNIQSIKWKGLSSASGGVAWLTKTEFINQYEEVFNECK